MTISQYPFYLPVEGGECFCLYRRPEGEYRGTLLHLPAFGDEMNKSRAMTARAARAFAARGFGTLQIDLLGCGDSSGEHGDATLANWIENASRAIDWLRSESSAQSQVGLWALRAGALLIPSLLDRAGSDALLLLWQPILSGSQQLNQILRQKLAGSFLDAGGERGGMRALRARLAGGETLEVGGYAISATLARDLERATCEIPAGHRGPVAWFEVTASPTLALSPLARTKTAELRSTGVDVGTHVLAGPGFWQSAEIEHSDALIETSADALVGMTDGVSRDPVVL